MIDQTRPDPEQAATDAMYDAAEPVSKRDFMAVLAILAIVVDELAKASPDKFRDARKWLNSRLGPKGPGRGYPAPNLQDRE